MKFNVTAEQAGAMLEQRGLIYNKPNDTYDLPGEFNISTLGVTLFKDGFFQMTGTTDDMPKVLGYTSEQVEAAVRAMPVQGKAEDDIPDDKCEAYEKGYADALTDVLARLAENGGAHA